MYPVPIWAPILTKPDPTLRLDWQFATDRAFAVRRGPTPTFTRSTTATYEDSTGVIRTAAVNEPRIDFDPTTLACSGLLLEEARTNFFTYSGDFTNVAWATGYTKTGGFTAPDGTSSAVQFSGSAASISSRQILSAPSTTMVFSIFFKNVSRGAGAPLSLLIRNDTTSTNLSNADFYVNSGVLNGNPAVNWSVKAYPNGWYRITCIQSTGITVGNSIRFYYGNTGVVPDLGAFLLWGAQAEAGAFPTSYIPTTTASVPRGVDVLEITGANFSNFWNQPEGTLVLEMQKAYSVTSAISQINYLSVNDGTLNNYIHFAQRAVSVLGEVFRVEFGGTSQVVMAAGAASSGNGPINATNTPFRLGGAYKANDFAAAINGSDCGIDTTGSVPTLTQLQFVTVTSANHIRSLQYYGVRKTNAELTRLTQLSTLDPALTLDLQFALDATYFSRRGPTPAFTRLTNGSFVGSDGLIKIATANTPRIEYDPITRQCLGLLIEQQTQNLVTWSEDVTQAAWAKTAATATGNTTVAPDGNSSADTLAETIANSQHYIALPASASVTVGTTYTCSCFFKKGSGATAPDWILFSFPFSNFGSRAVAFNVSTGAFGASIGGASLAFSAKQFSNGWFRVSITAAATTSGSSIIPAFISFLNNTNTSSIPTYVGQTTSDLFVWGAQFETGFMVTSYVLTTTSPFTRSAEVCDITAAAFTRFYNQTEGTVVVKFDRPSLAVSNTQLAIDDNTVNERIINVFSSGVERFGIVDTGGGTINLDVAFPTPVNTPGAHAGRMKLNDFAFSVNGSSPVFGPSQTVPTVTQMTLGQRNNANHGNGHIRAIQYYIVGKTNAQLQALSVP